MLETSNIARLPIKTNKRGEPSIILTLRGEYRFTVVDAASALATTSANVEHWEANPGLGPQEDLVRASFEDYKHSGKRGERSNLIFGTYPLKLAREILGLNIDEIAASHGYKRSMWQKFESNDRELDRGVLLRLEDDVREHFLAACSQDDQ
jgi:DNA-binding transcriptional regulator YiaG